MLRIYTDERFWSPDESRIEHRRIGYWIKLWRIRRALPGFTRDIVRVLHIEWR